ncbi:MAG: hypothetical protein NVSMB38_07270 [Ktedonobacteraceae bacterium]
MPTPPIRTITLGIADSHPIAAAVIKHASKQLHHAHARFTDAGYEVQTLRLSTHPLFDDLVDWSAARRLAYAQSLQKMLDDAELSFCALGTVHAARSGEPLEHIEQVVAILATTTVLNMTVQLASVEYGLREEAALPIARVMQCLAQETAEGFGNFRFAMLACVEPGCPFFPSAYHAGPTSLSLGLQGAGIVMNAVATGPGTLTSMTERVRAALLEQATPIVTLGQVVAAEQGIAFGGIDLSPAPLAVDSIAAAIEQYSPIGAPGTLATVAALTSALKSTGLATCGYNGLMLPVLEDAILGKRWEEGLLHVHQLLLYSAVCGTGLDTVPLAGDTPVEAIAQLLLDVATLALRLRKPLSARLFPVAGKHAGEKTTFSSPYLTNTLIKDLR